MGFRGLADVDPLAVPLPHGTQVTTRVDRVVGDRRVPQGAIGRVVGSEGDELDVHVVGVGTVRYLRRELVARKVGQLRFATERESAWAALRDCAVLETTVGSHAWGLADETSDTDVRGVFVLPFPWTAGLVEPPQDLVSADGSATFWEIGKTIRQALRADPNTLELLFVASARPLDPVGAWLLEARDAFVSAEIYGSFGRYALSQLKKLEQSQRLAEHRGVVLAWLREEPDLTLDRLAAKLVESAELRAPSRADAVLRAKEYVKQLYRSMYDQGLLDARELAALARFARDEEGAFELPRELRPKNAYNLVRLLSTAIGWLRSGAPSFEVGGALRETLLAIKRGAVPLGEVLRMAEALTPELEAARQATRLPRRGDLARADALLRRVREEVARRWLAGAPGRLGVDAPPAPEPAWEDS